MSHDLEVEKIVRKMTQPETLEEAIEGTEKMLEWLTRSINNTMKELIALRNLQIQRLKKQ